MLYHVIGRLGALAGLVALAACAQQPAVQPAAAAPASTLSLGAAPPAAGMGSAGATMPAHGMVHGSTPGHTMSHADMQAMMGRCAEMRRQSNPRMAMPAGSGAMAAECDAMDGMMNGMHGTAPAR